MEGEEDVTCRRSGAGGHVQYEQVKTVEDPTQLWSIAKVCEPDGGKVDRSILAKLFLGKDLAGSISFVLVLNEGVAKDLRVLTKVPANRTASELSNCSAAIAKKLSGISLPRSITVDWCVERLQVHVRPRGIEEFEALAIDRISDAMHDLAEDRPLHEELENVFSLVMERLSGEARDKDARSFDVPFVVNRPGSDGDSVGWFTSL